MAINVDNRKTKLDDNASLYTATVEKTEKEKWAELSFKGKMTYLKDYYLTKFLVCVGIIAFIAWIVITVTAPKAEVVLSVASVGNLVGLDDSQKITDDMLARLELDDKTVTWLFDTTYGDLDNDTTSVQKIALYYMTGELDGIIIKYNHFLHYAGTGWYGNLEEKLESDVFELVKDDLIYSYKYDDDGNRIEDSYAPYGINISKIKLLEDYPYQGDVYPVFGICVTSKNNEEVNEFIRYLYGVK
ncbi:MAG: hypothetical protein MJ113_00530 [Lachnospiraceae bacterium]|nr:hypothetical protein [Lachnospiraceae bacterium]